MKGYIQDEGINYDGTFAHVTMMEVIIILIAFTSYMGFNLIHLDLKSTFLNGYFKEEVYVKQPPSF